MLRPPNSLDLKSAGIAFVLFSLIAVPFAMLTGLLEYTLIQDPATLFRVAIVALLLSAVFEEVIFRGPIAWLSYKGSRKLLYVVAASLVLFVLCHPINGTFLLTAARELFTDIRFLVVMGTFGIGTSILAIKTCSLWASLIFHWLVMLGWIVFFGGPSFL